RRDKILRAEATKIRVPEVRFYFICLGFVIDLFGSSDPTRPLVLFLSVFSRSCFPKSLQFLRDRGHRCAIRYGFFQSGFFYDGSRLTSFLVVFLVVADEAVGRSVPFVFLERVKEDFMQRYGASIDGGGPHPLADEDEDDDLFEDRFSIAYNLDREFGYVKNFAP
ncbi:hypothetical protein BHM03_00035398, partial [Ensete ventricosum]